MNGKDMFLGLGYVDPKFLEEAESVVHPKGATKLFSLRRPVLIAALIALLLMLVGCGAAIYAILAEEPWASIPRVEGSDIPCEDINITVTAVAPTYLGFHCDIEGFGIDEKSVFFYQDPPCTIDRKTGDGWQTLPRLVDDPQWKADTVLTNGHHDGAFHWTAHYGALEPGVYRITAPIVQGHDDFTLEFEITEEMRSLGLEMAEDLANREFWHIRETYHCTYGPLDKVPPEAMAQFATPSEEDDDVSEYWRCGDDYLYLMYDGENLIHGMLYRDGVKYKLVREWESNDAPIVGWMPWPDMDLNRLTEWRYVLESEGNQEVFRREDGTIEEVVLIQQEKDRNGLDVDVTYTTTLQVLATPREEVERLLAGQDTNVWQAFSWEEDQKTYTARDVPFLNTTPSPVTTTTEALALAEKECSVEYTQVKVYRDEEAGIWKIEYQIFYGYQGYQYVYLNDDGITVMISGAGSKVEQWQTDYPGP